MYRWVDENGVTVYSQTPPPSGDAVKLKKQHAPSTEAANAARERLRKQREQAFDADQARKEAEAEQAKQAADDAQRAKNCSGARANLEMFRNLGRRMIRTPDGKIQRLSEEEVKMQIDKARGQIEAHCN